MYEHGGHRHRAEVDGHVVDFDSDLEERVLRSLLERGFSKRWRRPSYGLKSDQSFYTPDLELAIERGGKTHRALVEIKPALAFFHADVTLPERMRGIASYYQTTYFLVYTDKEQTWWQMNPETGVLGPCLSLEPGRLSINQLPQPFSLKKIGRTGREYRSNPHLIRNGLLALAAGLEVILSELVKVVLPPSAAKRPRRRSPSRRKR